MAIIEIFSHVVRSDGVQILWDIVSDRPAEHLYLVYTDDSGKKRIIRGGPEENGLLSDPQGPWFGNLNVIEGVFDESSSDYFKPDLDVGYEHATAIAPIAIGTEADVEQIWNLMKIRAAEITEEEYDYSIWFGDNEGQNSNTAYHELVVFVNTHADTSLLSAVNFSGGILPQRGGADVDAPGYLSELTHVLPPEADVVTYRLQDIWVNGGIAHVLSLPAYLEGGVGVEGAFGTWFEPVRNWSDPLAVDLDGTGDIETLPADSVYFDIDADGMAEAVSWISSGDGWLAIDSNENGKIDGVGELFGSDGTGGFAALAALDTNADGKIDAQDAAYSQLVVWQDKNSDGVSQAGELLSIADDLFIREVSLTHVNGVGTAEAAIGQLHVEDMVLAVDNRNAVSTGETILDLDVLFLPELRGYGRVQNLSLKMSEDADLKASVQALTAQSLTQLFSDFVDFRDDFNTVLYKWAGVNSIAIDSRGPNVDDARKLELLEEMDDREFMQFRNVATSSNPQTLTGEGIMQAYDVFERAVFARFLLQMGGDALFDNSVIFNRFTDEITAVAAPVLNTVTLNDLGTAGAVAADKMAYWKNIAFVLDNMITGGVETLASTEITKLNSAIALSDNTLTWAAVEASYNADFPPAPIAGTAIDDTFYGTSGDDQIDGFDGHDAIYGYAGVDILDGGNGDDEIYAGEGADILRGGAGNDILDGGDGAGNLFEGGAGDDTYITYLGSNDTFVDTGGYDVLETHISLETAYPDAIILGPFNRYFDEAGTTGNDLVIKVRMSSAPNDDREIYVQNYFDISHPENIIDEINLTAIGTTYNQTVFLWWNYVNEPNVYRSNRALYTYGSTSGDIISSTRMEVWSPNDTTTIGEVIYAGSGDDVITVDGNNVRDQIHAYGEDGNDTFIMKGDKVANYLNGNPNEMSVEGGAGNDVIIMESGLGGAIGEAGNDTYIYQGGFFNISELAPASGGGMADKIILDQEGLSFSDLSWNISYDKTQFNFRHDPNNSRLYIYKIYMFDQLIINDDLIITDGLYTMHTWYRGTTGADTVTDDVALGYEGDDILTGTAGNDILGGGDGDDTLNGAGAGSDWLDGGRGNDALVYALAADLATDTSKTYAIGGSGVDTLRLYMTAAQYAIPEVYNELKAAQHFFLYNQDTTKLNHNEYAFTQFHLVARDIETLEVYVDNVLTDIGAVINNTPVAGDDSFSVYETANLTGNLLADNGGGVDSDPERTVLSVTAATLTTANNGSVTIAADGTFTYVAVNGYIGTDSFNYTLNDADGGTDTGTVTVDVQVRPNRAPEAVDDDISLSAANSYSGNVLQDNGHNGFGVDFDLDRDTISVTADTIATSAGGSVTILSNGDFTYTTPTTPVTSDSFVYELNDDRGGTDAGTVYLNIIVPEYEDPVAIDDRFISGKNEVLTGSLFADNGVGVAVDSSQEGTTFTVVAASFTTANGGAVVVNADGTFSYTPITNFTGTDTFNYTILDSNGLYGAATVSLIVANIYTGTSGDNTINGTSGSDVIRGLGGKDTLLGGAGDDLIDGGIGSQDILRGAEGNDILVGGVGDQDKVIYDTSTSAVEVNLHLGYANDGFGYIDTLVNIEAANGGDYNDSITGSNSADRLHGMSGNDVVTGLDGNDWIWGDDGDDTLDGGAGNDTYYYDFDDGDDLIVEADTSGSDDYIYSSTIALKDVILNRSGDDLVITFQGHASDSITIVDHYTVNSIENMKFADGIILGLTENAPVAVDDRFISGKNEVLTGSLFADNGVGVAVDSSQEGTTFTVVAASFTTANGGAVVVNADGTFSYTPITNFTGTDTFNYTILDSNGLYGAATVSLIVANIYTGTSGDNTINGTSGSDVIRGLGGKDTLLGGAGDDLIDGGIGSQDILRGAEGNDILVGGVGDQDKVIYDTSTSAVEVNLHLGYANDGFGYIDTLVNIEAANGGDYNDSITGSNSADRLHGMSGNDVVTGLDGNDWIWGDDGDDTLSGDAGTDTLTGSSGADTFVFNDAGYGSSDTIADFNTGAGDKLDLRDLLEEYDPLTDVLTDFVQITTSGSNSFVKVDLDGTGGTYSWSQVASITGVTGLTDEDALVTSGNLLVA